MERGLVDMPTYINAVQVNERCQQLARVWAARNVNFANWYDTLALYDDLKQKNMESVVSNDPRTFYNTALHLLAPNIPHRIPVQGLDREAIAWASSVERAVKGSWAGIDRQYRRRGRKSWMEYVTGLLLATGWYAVLSMATEDKLIAEAWNPVEVYPDWDSQGLATVAHVFTITNSQAVRLFRQREWDMPQSLRNKDVTISDLWDTTEDGVINVTTADGHLVKEETPEPFDEIPVFVGPAGGLPDDGPINAKRRNSLTDNWRANIGQSILATNQDMYKQQNRIMTFMQQILRDTAQPKYWEKSRGGNILTPEDLEARGAIFRLGEGDDVGTIQMPGIPVELTSVIGAYGQMIQRGSTPHALSGEVQNIPLGLMSQVAAAAVQVLSRYHNTLSGLLTDIDNTWVDGILAGVYQSEVLTIPENIPTDSMRFDIQYPISVPGDLIQRATVMRMIAPSARISNNSALDLLLPEIEDPVQEAAQARADDAYANPVFGSLALISALREEARMLRQSGHNEDAELLERGQDILIAQMMGEAQAPGANGAEPAGIPPAGMSPDSQALMGRLGVDIGGQA